MQHVCKIDFGNFIIPKPRAKIRGRFSKPIVFIFTNIRNVIKPKINNNDEWIKIQLKTTGHIQKYQYQFTINNKNYDNHLLILLSIENKEMWYFNGRELSIDNSKHKNLSSTNSFVMSK